MKINSHGGLRKKITFHREGKAIYELSGSSKSMTPSVAQNTVCFVHCIYDQILFTFEREQGKEAVGNIRAVKM